ncbi:hypothetical protein BJX99DRAFT_254130 [Aspergillus californicus]
MPPLNETKCRFCGASCVVPHLVCSKCLEAASKNKNPNQTNSSGQSNATQTNSSGQYNPPLRPHEDKGAEVKCQDKRSSREEKLHRLEAAIVEREQANMWESMNGQNFNRNNRISRPWNP